MLFQWTTGHARDEQRSKWRFLLIWPIVTAYRRNVRQNLSWRLAGSHHSTVLLTLFLIGLLHFRPRGRIHTPRERRPSSHPTKKRDSRRKPSSELGVN